MTTPSSGAISASNLQTELGYNSSTPVSLASPGARALAGQASVAPTSQISFSNERGKTFPAHVYISPASGGSSMNRNFPNTSYFTTWENFSISAGGANMVTSIGVFERNNPIAYWLGKYWAMFDDNTVKYSVNGGTWTTGSSLPGGNTWTSISYAGFPNSTTYIVLGDENGGIWYSTNGTSWTASPTVTTDTLSLGISCVGWGNYNGTNYWIATGYDVTTGAISFWGQSGSGAPNGAWTLYTTLTNYAGSFTEEVGSMTFMNNQIIYTVDGLISTSEAKLWYLDNTGASWQNVIDFSSLQTPTNSVYGAEVSFTGTPTFAASYFFAIFPGSGYSPGGLYYISGSTTLNGSTGQWTLASMSGSPTWFAATPSLLLANNTSTVWVASTALTGWLGYAVSGATLAAAIAY
jgi:hypothetical protein